MHVFIMMDVVPHLPPAPSIIYIHKVITLFFLLFYICNYSGLTCKVSARNDVACLTTDLLAALGKLEPVLIPLVLAFRYWARVSL